ncbi:uncharacterized protein Z520_06873 [Fonsecaea multimorphosa CBS 102226]|uniref:VOC domain-containing protein n=1 Tax=Fonsecaea multimorphosa CBS 102226 TaxID=1442371 RepID=A0A0D2IK80_9EURO|nr:uncharacterized protein Z520_06873 [Fonsecaea multimorphosa CBS 102226]KIX97421.1 hypothetical protein Z520_06873 [Fonsecaea multimorphosa CBS 102226]OAL23388.1 hypothetical protein AYO22_06438 [Fonsecaea multimorphosa]
MSSEAAAWTPPAEGSPCWIEIPARDIDKLKEFYSNLFPTWTWRGDSSDSDHHVAPFQFKDPKCLSGGLVKMPDDCGPNTQTLGSGVTVYHMVESLEKTEARIHELGGKTVMPKTAQGDSGVYINATDPEGNRFGIYQLVQSSGS